jgi:putative NADH-flavin reductase
MQDIGMIYRIGASEVDMKLAVFGSETANGLRFVKHAMRVGYDVQICTSSNALYSSHSRKLFTVPKSPSDTSDIGKCIYSCDAVVILMNETVSEHYFELILRAINESSVARLVVCDDMLTESSYEDFNKLSTKLTDIHADWTIIKPVHHDLSELIEQLDASSRKPSVSHQSLERFIVDQVTDSRYLGDTVIVTG